MRGISKSDAPVARELAPARSVGRLGRSSRGLTVVLRRLSWGRFATQREQAPSPRERVRIYAATISWGSKLSARASCHIRE
jgi:hypothetical protein